MLRIWEGLFKSVDEGILPEESIAIIGHGGAFNNNFFRSEWFGGMRSGYSDRFVAYFETLNWNIEQ